MDRRLLAHPGCANKDIRTMIQEVMSVSYGVSATLIYRDVRDINWMPPFDGRALNLVKKCSLHELNADRPALASPVKVEIALKGGKTSSHEQTLRPLSDIQVKERFLHTARKHYQPEKASRILEMILNMERMESVRNLTGMLD